MRREMGKTLTFAAIGCLTATAIGFGVWRSTAPAPTLATTARGSATTTPEAAEPLPTTASQTQVAPVSPPATDPREGPVEARTPGTNRVIVDRSDPLLPPNAFIPESGVGVTRTAQPTMTFRPSAEPAPTRDLSTTPAQPSPTPGRPSTTEQQPTATSEDASEEQTDPPSSTPAVDTGPTESSTADPGAPDDVDPPAIEPPEPPLVLPGKEPDTEADTSVQQSDGTPPPATSTAQASSVIRITPGTVTPTSMPSPRTTAPPPEQTP